MSSLEITLLGTFAVHQVEQDVDRFSTAKARALLTYIACEGTRPLSRSTLATLLWPDRLEESARGSLRQALSNLGRVIGNKEATPPYLRIGRHDVQLNPDALAQEKLSIDVLRFQSLFEQAKENLDAASMAANLYGGSFLDTELLIDSPEFDGWVQVQREVYHRQMADLLLMLYEDRVDQGNLTNAIPFAQKLVDHEPWREDAHVRLMQTLWDNHQADVAMRQYDLCRRILREEFEIEPSPETTSLYEAIRDNRRGPNLRLSDLKPDRSDTGHSDAGHSDAGRSDAGRSDTVSAQQTPPSQAKVDPASTSIEALTSASHVTEPEAVNDPAPARHNLPPKLKAFFGREQEMAQMVQRFAEPNCRQMTVVGPGGMGKTQLALEYARRVVDSYSDGAWFVSLVGVADSQQIPSTIADSLGISMAGAQNPLVRLCDHLSERSLLLVLDNFEHLHESALLIPELLNIAPQVSILVTSRERLNLQVETVFMLGGLALPPLPFLAQGGTPQSKEPLDIDGADHTQISDAVALFVDSARRAELSFTLTDELKPVVAAICHLIDGMPLGIELAAVWTRQLSCQEILENLQRSIDLLTVTMPDIPSRHRSMRGLFEDSWQKLSASAQHIFAQASIFRGGCDRLALEKVTRATLLHLMELLESGFLRRETNGSYQIHELMRQFGAEKLAQSPAEEDAVAQRHATYYLHFLQQMEAELFGNRQATAAQTMSACIGNVRAAWQWALEHRAFDQLAAAAEGHFKYYHVRALAYDGSAIFGPSAEKLESDGNPPIPLLVRFRNYMGSFLVILGRTDECIEMMSQNLDVAREHALINEVGWALIRLGYALAWRDAERAIEMFEESYIHFQQTDDTPGMIASLGNLWYFVGLRSSDLQPAVEMAMEALQLSRNLEAPMLIATNLARLGRTSIQQGLYEQAWTYSSEALELVRGLQNKLLEAELLSHLGVISRNQGDYVRSLEFHEEALRCHSEINLESASSLMACENLGRLAIHMEAWEQAQTHFQQTIAKCERAKNAFVLARCQEGLALVWVKLGRFGQARQELNSAIKMKDLWESNDSRVLILESIILLLMAESAHEKAAEVLAYKIHHHRPNPHSTFDESNVREALQSVLGDQQLQAIESKATHREIDQLVDEVLDASGIQHLARSQAAG